MNKNRKIKNKNKGIGVYFLILGLIMALCAKESMMWQQLSASLMLLNIGIFQFIPSHFKCKNLVFLTTTTALAGIAGLIFSETFFIGALALLALGYLGFKNLEHSNIF